MTACPEQAIRALIDQETAAWDTRNVEQLLELFHPDMVWAWPPSNEDHDPVTWQLHMGRFDRVRWGDEWRQLFSAHQLIHNRRQTVAIRVSEQGDAGFGVVDVDTLWRHRQTGEEQHWLGRATKLYVDLGEQWKMIDHVGLLVYEEG